MAFLTCLVLRTHLEYTSLHNYDKSFVNQRNDARTKLTVNEEAKNEKSS